MERSKKLVMFCIVAVAMVAVAMATLEDDEKDCADQLTNLAACIPFVSGSANKPTQQCCEDTKKVRSAKPKCLCVLIKESTDPSLGLPVNTTLALQMPSACNIDAKISDCPSILNLPPDSPDAKIFKEADGGSSTSSTTDSPPASTSASSTTSPSSSSSGSGSGSGSDSDSKASPSSSNGAKLSGTSTLVIMGWASSIAWMCI